MLSNSKSRSLSFPTDIPLGEPTFHITLPSLWLSWSPPRLPLFFRKASIFLFIPAIVALCFLALSSSFRRFWQAVLKCSVRQQQKYDLQWSLLFLRKQWILNTCFILWQYRSSLDGLLQWFSFKVKLMMILQSETSEALNRNVSADKLEG